MSIKFLPSRIAHTLDRVLEKKLTIIEAGAGYGKTTLLSRWIEERQLPSRWYTPDNFPCTPLSSFADNTSQDRLALVSSSKPLLLVFDNWHTLADDREMLGMINNLVQNTPPHVHLILCTRVNLFLPGLTCMEPEDEILRIDESILAFKPEEIGSFIVRGSGVILSLEQIEWLLRETEGWPLALHWAGRTVAKELHWNPEKVAKVWREKIFPYFQAEVLENFPTEKQEFLLTLAVATEISAGIFGPLLGLDEYQKNLTWATQHHAFLSHSAETWRFHRLFQDFLQSRVLQNNRFYQEITLSIGNLHLDMGRLTEAIPYLIQATAYLEAGRALEELVLTLQREYCMETFEKLLPLFPEDADKHLPHTLLTFGEELTKAGRTSEALPWLRRASLGFGQLGDDLGITRSLCAMGTVYTTMGLTEEAETIYRQTTREIPSDDKNRAIVQTYLTCYEKHVNLARENNTLPRLRLHCFGTFEIFRGEERLDFVKWRRKALLMLKYLTLQPVHKATKEQLLDLFWPDEPPTKASNSYYVTLHSLRQGLSAGLPETVNYLKVERGAVTLIPALLATVDVKEFALMVQEGHRLWPIRPEQAVQRFQTATNLYHGDLLEGDRYEEWLFPLRDQLRKQYLEALTHRAEHATTNQMLEYALKLWNEVIRHDATHEHAVRKAMQLMGRLNRRSDALQCYQRFCHILKEELDTEPEPETLKLYNTLLKPLTLRKNRLSKRFMFML